MAGLVIDPRHPTPIYAQLEHEIRGAIHARRLSPGDQLPTVRQLAAELRVNANTVARVYAALERAGLLETRRGIGTFVATDPATPVQSRTQRDTDLRALARRVLNEAAARGFTADDLIRHLKRVADSEGG